MEPTKEEIQEEHVYQEKQENNRYESEEHLHPNK